MEKKDPDGLPPPAKEKIKNAAQKLFIQKGYFATSVRDIAKEAHLNNAAINYYFQSKEKLFESILIENFTLHSDKITAYLLHGKSGFSADLLLFLLREVFKNEG